jgi:RNA polymerase sigma-70 factor (ECF subfamily)
MITDTRTAGFVGWVDSLARTHTRRLAAFARAHGLRAEDALDAVQEAFHTFLILPQARSLVGEEEDCAKLLTVIVRNAARNMRRRHSVARSHVPVEDHEPVSSDQVDDLVERAEAHVRLQGCLQMLSESQRRVVTLRMLEQLSGDETAEELGLSRGNVAVMLLRAKRELERCLVA